MKSKDEADDSSRNRLRKYLTLAAEMVGLVGGIAAIIFLVRPDLQPEPSTPNVSPARTEAQLKPLDFDPRLERWEYLDTTDQARTGFTQRQLEQPGVFVRFRVSINGFEGITLTLKRELFDTSRRKEYEDKAITITPPAASVSRVWHDWVPLPSRPGRFYVVIKLLAPGEVAPLDRLRTPEFDGSLQS
jgi:hypothetical protein